MSRRAHRRLRLPADDRTPAVARAAVRQVLLAGGRAEYLDEALLLVSELSTNGIVHAGTPVEVDVLADESGVTITVADQRTGPVDGARGARSGPFDPFPGVGAGVPANAPAVDLGAVPEPAGDDTLALTERGRGLLLVDRLASSWGISHHAAGTSVWFRLGPGGDGREAPAHILGRAGAPPRRASVPADDASTEW